MPLRCSVTLVLNLGNETGRVYSAGTAPERDRPSEGCQLLVRNKANYVAQRRQVKT